MHRIPLRTERDSEGELAWADVVRQVVRRPRDPRAGADVDELRRGIRILDALERSNGTLELEDADWEHLRDKTLVYPWGIVDRRLLAFVEDVTGA